MTAVLRNRRLAVLVACCAAVVGLAAWLVLRSGPPLWHRLWLLAGVATMQAISLGNPLPQLMWDFGWLVILGLGAFSEASAPASTDGKSRALPPGAEVTV